jgi:AcrR family transcriptional regulator
MTSIRNKPVAVDSRTAILDAAEACILAVGVRRTTLADVARRAGVSRMTVYRSFPDVGALLGGLMADAAAKAGHLPTARQRLVASTVAQVRAISDEPLFRKVAEVDADLLLPYVFERVGATQRVAAGLIRAAVLEGQGDGSIRAGDARLMAHTVVMTAQSFVLGARLAGAPARRVVLDELGLLLDRYLQPEGTR